MDQTYGRLVAARNKLEEAVSDIAEAHEDLRKHKRFVGADQIRTTHALTYLETGVQILNGGQVP